MTWLLGQLWPLLLVSFLLGAATVVLWGQRRQTVEVWEDVPVPPPAEESPRLEEPEEPEPASVGTPVPVDADDPDSPFPIAAASDPKPWEAEELWSRPARLSASGEAKRPKDEWTEAAENWRSWADEATGRGYAGGGPDAAGGPGAGGVSDSDRDLFAADRDLFAADREEPPAAEDETVDVFPGAAGTSYDDFPYARPVEAAPAAETMDPMNGTDEHEMTDDEREAAEIRRMRAQAQGGTGSTGSTDGDRA